MVIMQKSNIKIFKENAKFDECEGDFNFEEAKTNLLKNFDSWRQEENPHILSIDFGKKDGIYIEDSPHYWYIRILYDEK